MPLALLAESLDPAPPTAVLEAARSLRYRDGDDLWDAIDEDLLRLGRTECERLGLLRGAAVEDGTVLRMPKAYPVYDHGYARAVRTLRAYLSRFENLACVGRNGQHRYNNQDHSMLTALHAARNRVGAEHDLWAVNTEPDYHEGGRAPDRDDAIPGDARAVPVARVSVASGES